MQKPFFSILATLVFGFLFSLSARAETPMVPQNCQSKIQSLKTQFQNEILFENTDHNTWMLRFKNMNANASAVVQKIRKILFAFENQFHCLESFVFVAPKEDDLFYTGKSYVSDYKLFQDGKISEPEWQRRLFVEEKAGQKAVIKNLKIARRAKNKDQSLFWVEKWLKLTPEAKVPLLIKANLYLDHNEYQKALVFYDKVLELDSKNEVALFNQAYTFFKMGKLNKAILAFENLFKNFDAYAFKFTIKDALILHLTKAYLKNRDVEKAQKTLAQIKTKNYESDLLWAQIYRAQKKFETAEVKLKQLQTYKKHQDQILYNQILLKLDLQKAEEAQTLYRELQKQNPVLAKELAFLPVWKN